ncbi:MAG: hypothetical protein CTY15_00930 [Methylocystis sp.]|nr:MAG: hypothetical protein CTY15_00930 [Methylocystis sp.]
MSRRWAWRSWASPSATRPRSSITARRSSRYPDVVRIPPWARPESVSEEEGWHLARDRIAWRSQGYPDPSSFEGWSGDGQVDYLLSRPTPDTLDLSGLGLRRLPQELSEAIGLSFLFLDSNRLESVPVELLENLSLESLSLFANPLREAQAALFALPGLKDLYLGRTPMTRLGVPPKPVETLQMLTLDMTEWLDVPEGFLAALPNLTALSMDNAFRKEIPPEAFGLKNLRQLSFAGNALSALPPEIGRLSNLRSLNLEGCKLQSLPRALAGLQGLADAAKSEIMGLRIAGNPFRDKELKRIAKLKNPERTLAALDWADRFGD